MQSRFEIRSCPATGFLPLSGGFRKNPLRLVEERGQVNYIIAEEENAMRFLMIEDAGADIVEASELKPFEKKMPRTVRGFGHVLE